MAHWQKLTVRNLGKSPLKIKELQFACRWCSDHHLLSQPAFACSFAILSQLPDYLLTPRENIKLTIWDSQILQIHCKLQHPENMNYCQKVIKMTNISSDTLFQCFCILVVCRYKWIIYVEQELMKYLHYQRLLEGINLIILTSSTLLVAINQLPIC